MQLELVPRISQKCYRCKEIKALHFFNKSKSRKTKHQPYCRECEKNIYKARLLNPHNRELKKRSARKSYYKDPHRNKLKGKEKRLKYRLDAIKAYGQVCVCCGETRVEFLTLDHVFNDGHRHRSNVSYISYRDAKTKNFPDIYQVLCYNCNMSKGHQGYCPHESYRKMISWMPEEKVYAVN